MTDFSSVTVSYGAGETKTLLELTKSIMGISCVDANRDDELTLSLQMAGNSAEKYTTNALAKRQVTESFSHKRTPLLLHYFPFVDGLTVSIDGEDVTDQFEVIEDQGLFWLVENRCGKHIGCCFQKIQVSYNAGHEPLPAELGYVIARAAKAYAEQSSGSGSIKKESVVGVGTVEYVTEEGQSGGHGMFSGPDLDTLDNYLSHAI